MKAYMPLDAAKGRIKMAASFARRRRDDRSSDDLARVDAHHALIEVGRLSVAVDKYDLLGVTHVELSTEEAELLYRWCGGDS